MTSVRLRSLAGQGHCCAEGAARTRRASEPSLCPRQARRRGRLLDLRVRRPQYRRRMRRRLRPLRAARCKCEVTLRRRISVCDWLLVGAKRPFAVMSVPGDRAETLMRRSMTVSDPNVCSGRALQEVLVELAFSGLASIYPVSDWSCSAPDHHGYQRACVLVSGQASTGHLGHQVSHAPGRPILHLFSFSRRPRQVTCFALATSSRAPHFERSLWPSVLS